jgi:hypothetical protein
MAEATTATDGLGVAEARARWRGRQRRIRTKAPRNTNSVPWQATCSPGRGHGPAHDHSAGCDHRVARSDRRVVVDDDQGDTPAGVVDLHDRAILQAPTMTISALTGGAHGT